MPMARTCGACGSVLDSITSRCKKRGCPSYNLPQIGPPVDEDDFELSIAECEGCCSEDVVRAAFMCEECLGTFCMQCLMLCHSGRSLCESCWSYEETAPHLLLVEDT